MTDGKERLMTGTRPRGAPRAASQKGAAGLFRYSAWDAAPAALAVLHLALIAAFFLLWPQMSWPLRLVGGVAYALAIGWNQDSVAHNFIHNRFFASERLNRVMDFILTLENGAPQTMYRWVHMRHHAGNSDRPGPEGRTIDPISIYAHGRDGRPEPPLSYILLSFWRDDGPFEVARQIGAKRPLEARRAREEFWVMAAVYAAMAVMHWQFVAMLAPFYYLGQSASFLIAYYEHLGANPDESMVMGVSAYGRLYNLTFLNNGYHAEHHYRPKQHWTQMAQLRGEVLDRQQAAGLRVLAAPHFLGFLPSASRAPAAAGPR
jgi:fatty acid desaturase